MKKMTDCENVLKELINTFTNIDKIRNEAQTRHHIIDEIIYNVLDWPKDQVEVEGYEQKTFTDYELGKPRQVIIEAKREEEHLKYLLGYQKRILLTFLPC